jgi:type IV pilus assembly protein PilA
MKCPLCGETVPDDRQFCGRCGANLATGAQAAAAAMPPPPPVPPVSGPAETSGLAIGSLVSGIFFLFFPAAIAAIILGHISRADIKRSGGRKTGSGLALTGLILGYTGVAVIPFLIIAAIAIPNLLRSRIAANEAAAVSSLRTLNSALVMYNSTYGTLPSELKNLEPPASGSPNKDAADLVAADLASGTKYGYVFHYEASSSNGTSTLDVYRITAEPQMPNQTGMRYFYTDQSGVTRFARGERATENSPPI